MSQVATEWPHETQVHLPFSQILETLRARRHLLNAGARRVILSGLKNPSYHLDELFSGHLENLRFETYHHPGGPRSVVLGCLYHALGNMVHLATFLPEHTMRPEQKETLKAFFNFLDHPVLQMALAAYIGPEDVRHDYLEMPVFGARGFLAPWRGHWDWILSESHVQILMGR